MLIGQIFGKKCGKFLAMRKSQEDQTIERVGAELRKMMPFLKKRKEAGIPQA